MAPMLHLMLLCYCAATIVRSSLAVSTLPIAVVSPDVPEVLTFNVDSNGNDSTLQLNCSGVGNLIWYRDTVVLEDTLITLVEDNLLMLTISPVVSNIDADSSGIPYYCVANNTLGLARSRTVLVKYAYFDGFQSSNITTDVTVRSGEAVALKCDILGAVPSPDYIWFSDNTTIDTTTNTDKIRTLDDGATLVIYNLQASDTAPLYSCGLTNARMYDTEISTRLYRLIVTVTFSTPFVAYRVPPIETVITSTALADGVMFYYIGATNGGNTRLFSPGGVDATNSDATLSAIVDTGNLNILPNLFLTLIGNDNTLTDSRVDFKLTVREPLVVSGRPSNASTVYHRYTDESISFTCTGTGTTLQWYRNTELLSVSSNTLVLDTLVVDNAGVYQCFWEGSEDDTFAMNTWALVVLEPVQSITVTTLTHTISTCLLTTVVSTLSSTTSTSSETTPIATPSQIVDVGSSVGGLLSGLGIFVVISIVQLIFIILLIVYILYSRHKDKTPTTDTVKSDTVQYDTISTDHSIHTTSNVAYGEMKL